MTYVTWATHSQHGCVKQVQPVRKHEQNLIAKNRFMLI